MLGKSIIQIMYKRCKKNLCTKGEAIDHVHLVFFLYNFMGSGWQFSFEIISNLSSTFNRDFKWGGGGIPFVRVRLFNTET